MSHGRLPDFIVIGAERSGTTTLSRFLRAHPGVFMAQEKEVHFFDTDDKFDLGVDWYKSRFDAADPDQIVGEATPAYMAVTRAVERMANVVPDARLIALLRHPAERAYSVYWFARAWGAEQREPAEALGEAMRDPHSSERTLNYVGSYLDQLERVLHFYPPSSLMTLLFDDFVVDPSAAAKSVCEFIGADPSLVPNGIGSFRNEPRRILIPKVHEFGERVKARHFGVGDRILRMNSRKVKYPPLSGPLRSDLLEYFRPHNDALSQWLNRDLSHWNR